MLIRPGPVEDQPMLYIIRQLWVLPLNAATRSEVCKTVVQNAPARRSRESRRGATSLRTPALPFAVAEDGSLAALSPAQVLDWFNEPSLALALFASGVWWRPATRWCSAQPCSPGRRPSPCAAWRRSASMRTMRTTRRCRGSGRAHHPLIVGANRGLLSLDSVWQRA